jgi:hypothetical protein
MLVLLGISMRKVLTAILIAVLVLYGLVMVGSVSAQSIPKPSVPEFTVRYLDNSNYIPPTTTTDPYTGKTISQGGYYTTGEPEIEIKIKNQPFNSLYYQVQTKGHFSTNWLPVEYWIKEAPAYNPRNPFQEQDSSSQYTILKYGSLVSQNIPSSGKLDIQVQALIGYPIVTHTSDHIDLYNTWATFSFNGVASNWSDIQTISIPDGSVSISASLNPTPTSILPEFPDRTGETEPFPTLVVATASFATLVVSVIFLLYMRKLKPLL